MGKKLNNYIFVVMIVFLLSLVADSFLTDPNIFYQDASAPTREFEENITILPYDPTNPGNNRAFFELGFSQEDELEFIFTLKVKENLPIDFWFVNYANLVRLVDERPFLFFIDGSDQNVTQASKVISLTVYDVYTLVFVNNNNVSVEVNINYDVNVYPPEEEKEEETSTPLWKEYYVMLPLGLIIGIIAGLLISRVFKKSKQEGPEKDSKSPKKKEKGKPRKADKGEKEPEEPPKREKRKRRVKKEEPIQVPEKVLPKFCGHCGKPVTTPFCPHCGKEAGKA